MPEEAQKKTGAKGPGLTGHRLMKMKIWISKIASSRYFTRTSYNLREVNPNGGAIFDMH